MSTVKIISLDGAKVTIEHPDGKVAGRLAYEIRQFHAGLNGNRKRLADAEARVGILESVLKRIADFPCNCCKDSQFIPENDECESCRARAALKGKP